MGQPVGSSLPTWSGQQVQQILQEAQRVLRADDSSLPGGDTTRDRVCELLARAEELVADTDSRQTAEPWQATVAILTLAAALLELIKVAVK